MTLSEIPYVRPEMARPAPYRWQDNVPDGPVSRFDMNTLPLSPAAWPQIAAEVARLPSCSYPEATYRPLREAIGRVRGVRLDAGGAGCGLRRGPADVRRAGDGPRRPRDRLPADVPDVRGVERDGRRPARGARAARGDLTLDYEALLERAPGARLVWVCSPNNPTGEEIGARRRGRALRVVPGRSW